MARSFCFILLFSSLECACARAEPKPAPPAAPKSAVPAASVAPSAPSPSTPSSKALEATAANDPNEACGQMLLVAYKGAAHAKPSTTRDKPAALARAEQLLQKLHDGADFAALARVESDAPSSAPRGGVFGTYRRDDWPALHISLRDPLFALGVGQLAPAPIEADYGYVLLRRCPLEKLHARHILVRYKGAKNAEPSITRSKPEAAARARELRAQLKAGADFGELARKASDDASASRGGDLGSRGRGVFAPAFEQALFALQPNQISDPVETEFGYHIIQRLP